jgi:hypothetical protein
MKPLTALIIALASLSTVNATELQTSDPAVHLASAATITVAWNTPATESADNAQCKAVCLLPTSID